MRTMNYTNVKAMVVSLDEANALNTASQTLLEMRTQMERVDDVMEYPDDPMIKDEEVRDDISYAKLLGDIEIKNVLYKNTEPETSVFGAEYNPCHNFGYQAYFPENITIEGLSLETPAKLSLFSVVAPGCDFDPESDTVKVDGEIKINVNKTFLPKKIDVRDFPKNAFSFDGSPNSKLNSLLKFEINRKA